MRTLRDFLRRVVDCVFCWVNKHEDKVEIECMVLYWDMLHVIVKRRFDEIISDWDAIVNVSLNVSFAGLTNIKL